MIKSTSVRGLLLGLAGTVTFGLCAQDTRTSVDVARSDVSLLLGDRSLVSSLDPKAYEAIIARVSANGSLCNSIVEEEYLTRFPDVVLLSSAHWVKLLKTTSEVDPSGSLKIAGELKKLLDNALLIYDWAKDPPALFATLQENHVKVLKQMVESRNQIKILMASLEKNG